MELYNNIRIMEKNMEATIFSGLGCPKMGGGVNPCQPVCGVGVGV